MGMAAGQARLLSITARLSDNEQNGQALSFAKQRLADETDQINTAYNAALSSTKLTVLTGFNGTESQYTDISYGLLTDYNKLVGGKQYLVTNQKGQILVTDQIAQAYKRSNGDFNRFINYFGLSQNDVDFAHLEGVDEQTGVSKTIQAIHNAWDKYITSAGLYFPDLEHDYSNDKVHFGWNSTTSAVDENGNTIQNVGSPYFILDSVSANVYHATYTNVKVPDNSEVGYTGLIPNLAEGAEFSMRQKVDANGEVQTSNGMPVYIISAMDEDGNDCYYSISVQGSTTPVYDSEGENLIGNYHEVIILPCDANGNSQFSQVPIGTLFGNDISEMFPNDPLAQYYSAGYPWNYNIVADDYNNFYLTESAQTINNLPILQGLTRLNIVNNVYSREESVSTGVAKNIPLNYEGTTQEQRELYDYAVAVTQAYAAMTDSNAAPRDKNGNVVTNSIASNPENSAEVQYYRNIFNQIQEYGYVTQADMDIQKNSLNKDLNPFLKDNNWFEQNLRQGKLLLKTYDSSKGKFVNINYAEDSNIQEVEDDRKIAKAEIEYQQAQEALERKDKKIDLELKKLDTEHNALQTEYEAVKGVVDKNIEKSFNIFS